MAATGGTNRVELVGGPFDGGTIPARVALFVYVGSARRGPRGYAKPGRRRELYRQDGHGRFLHAQRTHSRCSCGGWNAAIEGACVLCGEALAPAPA